MCVGLDLQLSTVTKSGIPDLGHRWIKSLDDATGMVQVQVQVQVRYRCVVSG